MEVYAGGEDALESEAGGSGMQSCHVGCLCVWFVCRARWGRRRLEACSGGFNVMMAMQVGQLMRLTYCVIVCAYYMHYAVTHIVCTDWCIFYLMYIQSVGIETSKMAPS